MTRTMALTRRSALVAGIGASFAPFIRPAHAAREYRLTHPADTAHPVHIEAEKMVQRIADRTKGAVKITIFPNNTLGSPVETAQQTKLGAIDFMLVNPANIESMSKTIGVINIPYQFDGYEHARRTLDTTARDWLSEQIKAAGFQWIANFEWGFRALSNSRHPVNTPEDVKGLKIRVPPELAIKAAFEALGANTQTVAYQEVYLALANKTVDGQDNPVATTYAAKFFEAQSHIALTKHIYASIMFAANPRVWSGLSDEHRAIVTEESTAAGAAARKGIQDKEEWYLGEMKKAGLEITRPVVAPFRDKMAPAYDQLKKALGNDTWNTWAELVKQARTA